MLKGRVEQLIIEKFDVPGYARILGVTALIFAILGVIIPIFGVLVLTPISILLGGIALWARYRGIGITILVINAVNLVISPTFWINIGFSTSKHGVISRLITDVDVLGILILMLFVGIRKPIQRPQNG